MFLERRLTRSPSPHALLELEIPDRTQPILASGEWGINIAAARDLAPDKGLKIYIWPWSQMGRGDKVELLLNGSVVDQDTIDTGEVDQRVTLYVPPGRLLTGPYSLSYRVTRFNQAAETSTPVKIYVKLERPAGKDENGSVPGHSELFMQIPPAIVQDGVDKDTAEAGFDILIKARPGSGSPLLYPDIAVGDHCRLSWGGVFVFSERVSQAHIDDPANHPLAIRIDKDTILEAGDTDGLAVTFEVHDIVDNRSEDWSAEVRIRVDTGTSRLAPPIVKEAVNNVLDLDKLGDAPVTLQIIALAPDFKVGDVPVGLIRGTSLDGEAVAIEVRGEPLTSLPSILELKLPNAAARQLAKTQAVFSYRLERSGSPNLPSKGQFVQIVGEARRLAAPLARDAEQGSLDPELPSTAIDIPFDEVMAAGMVILLRWVGTKPDFNTYDPELPGHTLSLGEIEAKEPISLIVDGQHLRAIDGGTLDLFYVLLAEAEDGGTLRRESLHHAPLRVGEPLLELAAPRVLGEADGVLDPDELPGGVSRLTAPRANIPTKRGDKVTYSWIGSVTGKTSDSIDITSLNADKEVPFALNAAFVAAHIKPNRGGTVTASYEIYRAATPDTPERTSYSNLLKFSVGEAVELKTPPAILQAEPDGTTLQPIKAKDALTAVIPAEGLLPDDLLSVTWAGAAGTPADGSHTTPARPVSETGYSIGLPVSVLAFNLAKAVTVTFTITRDGKPYTSPALTLNVGSLPITALNSPIITDADGDGVLDLVKLGSKNVTVHARDWPLMAVGQQVWMSLSGKKANGSEHNLVVWNGGGDSVNTTWFEQGYWPASVVNSYFKDLADASKLTLSFKAALDKSNVEANALVFADQVYSIRAFEVVTPAITKVAGANGEDIPNGGTTVDTSLTLTGTASKGQKVQILDGTTNKGEATADASGNWSHAITGLSVAAHSFTAKALYGSGQTSAARTLTVVSLIVPTLVNVLDSNNAEVAEGASTISTTLTLKGQASNGMQVEIFDGSGPSAVSKGKATAHATTGAWTLTITVSAG
ncbi:hypothetical protein ACLD1X_26455, partial [Pseudomonas sp. 18173]